MEAVKFWFPIAISALLSVVCHPALRAGTAADALQARLVSLDGLVAKFTQQITDAKGYVLEEATGTLHLAKPHFRWQIEAPFAQIILAKGDHVQIYDPDLEQVTERDIDGAIDQAPLALLTRSELALDEHFVVDESQIDSGYSRYILRPTSDDALFERLELVFKHQQLDTLAIYDHAGQQTLIRFTEYADAQVIQSSMFELDYPPGTDFVRG